jgi:membrane-bound lytic murein transglycosylase MltF
MRDQGQTSGAWVRDGTTMYPTGEIAIDIRDEQSVTWITIKSDKDRDAEATAARVLKALNGN